MCDLQSMLPSIAGHMPTLSTMMGGVLGKGAIKDAAKNTVVGKAMGGGLENTTIAGKAMGGDTKPAAAKAGTTSLTQPGVDPTALALGKTTMLGG